MIPLIPTGVGEQPQYFSVQFSRSVQAANLCCLVEFSTTPWGVPLPQELDRMFLLTLRAENQSSPQIDFIAAGIPGNVIPLVSSIRSIRDTKTQNARAVVTLGKKSATLLRFSNVCGSRNPIACAGSLPTGGR